MKISLTKDSNLNLEQIKLLNNIAEKTRLKYNNVIKKLSEGNESNIDWWVSELASRNTFTNDLFLNLSYLQFVKELLDSSKKISEFIVDSRPLAKVLKKHLDSSEYNIKISCRNKFLESLKSSLKPLILYFINIYYFLSFYVHSKFIPSRKTISKEVGSTLIDIFIFDNSFKEGEFIDRYYYNFGNILREEEKINFYYLFTPIKIQRIMRMVKELRNSRLNFLFKEDFLRLNDYFFAFTYPFRALKLKPQNVIFENFDVTPLFTDVWYKNITSRATFEGLMKYKLARRLKENGIKIKLYVDWFENQIIDKGCNAGFRKFYPDIPIKGYQISGSFKFYLCYYPTEFEFQSRVLPTEIVVSGKAIKDSRIEFCDRISFSVAPAFRYCHIWNERKFFPDKNFFTVLLALPITLKDCNEILNLVSSIIEVQPENVRFWIKQHPSWIAQTIKNFYKKKWPERFVFVEGDFFECVEKSDLCIGNISTSLLETIAKGIPVIIIGSQYGLTQNPIPEAIQSDIWKLCYSKEDLIDAIRFYSDCDNTRLKEFAETGKRIREEYFEPITRIGVKQFLGLNN